MNIKNTDLIDWKEAKQLAGGNLTLAQELLEMFLQSLYTNMQDIQTLYEKKDYKALREIIHKLHGGICYCGLPALKAAIKQLEIALKRNHPQEISSCYIHFLSETKKLV